MEDSKYSKVIQDRNKCKWYKWGRYNCFVNWPLRCCLETGDVPLCEYFEPKEVKPKSHK